MTSTMRGRNGNPGAHELLYGEVDDAAAAVRWLAAREEVDAERIYVFGRSLGGGASALVRRAPRSKPNEVNATRSAPSGGVSKVGQVGVIGRRDFSWVRC